MSVASIVSYLDELVNGNSTNNPNKIGYTFNLPITRPANPVASGSDIEFLNGSTGVVIPRGKWMVSGTIGATATDAIGAKIDTLELILSKETSPNLFNQVYDILSAGGAGSANTFISSFVYISDGTNNMNANFICRVSGGSTQTWNIDPASSYCFVTFIKIANI